MKQTSVEWLVNEIKFARNLCDDPSAEMDIWHTLDVLIAKGEEAKAMEKEQMDKVAEDWWNEGASYIHDGRRKYESFQHYYLEIYGGEYEE
jgi:hypothetical protein